MIPLVRRRFATQYQDYERETIDALSEALKKLGYYAHEQDIHWAWRRYSHDRCAGFLSMDLSDADKAVNVLFEFLEPKI